MKKLLITFILVIGFVKIVFSKDNSVYKIDSVFISFNQKILQLTAANKIYRDSLVLYTSNDTVILLKDKTLVSFLVNGARVPGNYKGGKKVGYHYASFETDHSKIFVKTVPSHVEMSNIKVRDILYIIPVLFILIGIFYYVRNRLHNKTIPNVQLRSDGQEIVIKLESLGYFKFAANESINELKKDLTDSINNLNILSTILNEETLEPLDYRLYFCDGEDLYEEDGFTSNLERISSTFEKRNLKLIWAEEKCDVKSDGLYHEISLNGKTYTKIYNNKDTHDIWELAAKYFYLILDEQLTIQGSEENIYPISGGNDGQFLILTKEQFGYISSIGLDKVWEPKELMVWIRENEL